MRPFSFGHRWLQRSSKYSGPWAKNPWINATAGSLQRRKDLDCAQAAAVMIESEKVAIGTWEDEGGSVGPRRTMHC
jgi:hypothetical protein